MKVVALLSGGKDSCFSILKCSQLGHQIVAVANLRPINDTEVDSFMYQSVGSEMIEAIASCLDLPLYRAYIRGNAVQQSLHYDHDSGNSSIQDEVEDLHTLLSRVKEDIPSVEAVCSGAILSNYQRNRVENVCTRLGLVSLAYLWQQDQTQLLQEMIQNDMEAILIKVAAIGLNANHLGKSIGVLYDNLQSLHAKFGINVCGEGGEYESLVLDCPLFKKKIVIDEYRVIHHSVDEYAPVSYLQITKYHCELKSGESTCPPKVVYVDQRCDNNNVKTNEDSSLATSVFISNTKSALLTKNCATCQALGSILPPTSSSKQDTGYPQVSVLGNSLHIAQQSVLHSNGQSACCALPPDVPVDMEVCFLMNTITGFLEACNFRLSDVYFVCVYLRNMEDFTKLNSMYRHFFGVNPASRVTIGLNIPSRVMIECFASKSSNKSCLHVQSISFWAPACIGPYSQAYSVDNAFFLAGQIGLIPETMQIAQSFDSQSEHIVKHLNSVLQAFLPSDVQSLTDESPHSAVFVTIVFVTTLNSTTTVGFLNCWETFRFRECRSIVFFVEVSSLPKGASIEAQLSCVFDQTRVDDAPDWDFLIPRHNYHIQLLYGRGEYREFYLATMQGKVDHETVIYNLHDFVAEVHSYLQKTSLSAVGWDNVLSIRCFYLDSVLSAKAVESELSNFCVQANRRTPTVTLLPCTRLHFGRNQKEEYTGVIAFEIQVLR